VTGGIRELQRELRNKGERIKGTKEGSETARNRMTVLDQQETQVPLLRRHVKDSVSKARLTEHDEKAVVHCGDSVE
jgi:hypothetical protein